MKLVSIFFFNERIYSVKFKRIDNGPQCQNENSYHYFKKYFKNLKIAVSPFLWPSVTYLNEKKEKK